MPRLWPSGNPQFFSTTGVSYALRTGLLKADAENQTILIACQTGEMCGVNFWVEQQQGTLELHYSLNGAGAMYAIATDGGSEIVDIRRIGIELEEGPGKRASLSYKFRDARVRKTVIAIRLNEGLRNPRPEGQLTVMQLDLTADPKNAEESVQPAAWLALVPVTPIQSEEILRTLRFFVRETSSGSDGFDAQEGGSIEKVIEHIVEGAVSLNVSDKEMFEIQISRTAFGEASGNLLKSFMNAGRRYEVYALADDGSGHGG